MNNSDELPVKLQTRSNDIINILDNYKNDEYCSNLLTIFCANHPQTMGFNEIRRHLAYTTPQGNPSPNTLQKHLGHLIEHRVIQRREDKMSKMKIPQVIYSLTPEFIELGKDLFAANRGLDVGLLKMELRTRSVAEVSRDVAYILLRDAVDSVRDSLLLDPRIRDFKRALKSALLNAALDEFCMVVRDLGGREEALSVLLEVNEKLTSFTGFNNPVS
jgi:DNA-binding HxlR family transcriptional regulator